MDKEIINAAMQFMMRVNLSGQEVPAFNAVMNVVIKAELKNIHETGDEKHHECLSKLS